MDQEHHRVQSKPRFFSTGSIAGDSAAKSALASSNTSRKSLVSASSSSGLYLIRRCAFKSRTVLKVDLLKYSESNNQSRGAHSPSRLFRRMRGCIRMSEKLSKICGILTVSWKNVASFASYPTSSPPQAGVKKEEKKRRKKSLEIDTSDPHD